MIDKSLAKVKEGLPLAEQIIFSDFAAISRLTKETYKLPVGCRITVEPMARQPLRLVVSPDVAHLLDMPIETRAKTPFQLHDRIFPFLRPHLP